MSLLSSNIAIREDEIARAFHEAYERLAPEHNYKTREASAVPWEDVPADNKRLMRAVVRDLLANGTIDHERCGEQLDQATTEIEACAGRLSVCDSAAGLEEAVNDLLAIASDARKRGLRVAS